jgi:hypothetical protein
VGQLPRRGHARGVGKRRGGFPYTSRMLTLLALSRAWKWSLALIAVFGVGFPALVTGLLIFAISQSAAERRANRQRWRFRRR